MARGNLTPVEQGKLDRPLGLNPLQRISPSRYTQMIKCRLRGVWQGNYYSVLLPTSPTARLGIVAHKLLQLSAEAKLSTYNHANVESRWNELTQEIEQAMSNNWLERHLVPLQASVPRYEVVKQRALATAAEIAKSNYHLRQRLAPMVQAPVGGAEQRIQTPDGSIAGSIDRVVITDEGAVIQDYKTGDLLDDLDGKVQVKPEYRTQIMLYAALWAQDTGTWPIRLELLPLTGDPVQVPFEPAECLALIEHARTILRDLNTYIASESARAEIECSRDIASPSPEVCGMCQYRPLCPAYLRADKFGEVDPRWPKDIIGVVNSIDILQNSKLRLSVRSIDNSNKVDVARGITSSTHRHPALSSLRPGDKVGIYNLARPGRDQTYSESLLTTIYCYSGDLLDHLL